MTTDIILGNSLKNMYVQIDRYQLFCTSIVLIIYLKLVELCRHVHIFF